MNFLNLIKDFYEKFTANITLRDFPGGPVVKNLPSNAGDVGSILGQRTRIPHAAKPMFHNH